MLVQRRGRTLRLVRQHDHAMAAGRMAHAWRGLGPRGRRGPADGPGAAGAGSDGGRLPFRLVLAVALHDVAWRELDRRPRLDPERGRPFGFDEHPLAEKLEAYRRGLDEMEAVDPWLGLLGSLHYASFVGEDGAGAFLRREESRRRRLRAALAAREAGGGPRREGPTPDGGGGRDEDDREGGARGDAAGRVAARDVGRDPGGRVLRRARRWLRWLKFFDGLSLRLCLASPDVPEASVPPWMEREGDVETPEGPASSLRWHGPDRAVLDPFPLCGPLDLEIPVRDLPGRRYADQEELTEAWEAAPERTWRLFLSPPRGRAPPGGGDRG